MFDEAEDFVRTTLQVHETCGTKNPDLLASQHETWAEIAMARNQATIALEQGQLALSIRKKLYDEDGVISNQLTTSYTTVARALIMANQLDKAEELINESRRLRRALPKFSKLHLFTPLVYESLMDYVKGNYADAVMRLTEALEDRQEVYGHDDEVGKRSVASRPITLGDGFSLLTLAERDISTSSSVPFAENWGITRRLSVPIVKRCDTCRGL